MVADTIYMQLGGITFRTVTGATNFAGGVDYLSFKIPSNNKKRVSHIVVKYNQGLDTYDMKFLSIRGSKMKEVEIFENVLCFQLQELFFQVTGIYTNVAFFEKKVLKKN